MRLTIWDVAERVVLIVLAAAILLGVWALSARDARAGEWLKGPVTKILDGDTYDIGGLIVRTAGNDCPEKSQPYGSAAALAAKNLAFGKVVTIIVVAKRGPYGRVIARVKLPDGRDLGLELVKAGLAWARCKAYRAAEAEARRRKIGLWADPKPIPPWKWRRRNRRTR